MVYTKQAVFTEYTSACPDCVMPTNKDLSGESVAKALTMFVSFHFDPLSRDLQLSSLRYAYRPDMLIGCDGNINADQYK